MRSLLRYSVIVVVFGAIAVALRLWRDIPASFTLGALLIGWPLVGTLITADDDLPGGWSNPDGKFIPDWKQRWFWADMILVRGALVLAVGTLESQLSTGWSAISWLVCAAMLCVGGPIVVCRLKGYQDAT